MFGRIIREWRSLEEVYLGFWTPGGGHKMPPGGENPTARSPLKTPSRHDPMEPPEGVQASTGKPKKRPAAPPPIPPAARRKGPPPIPAR